jgi:DNA-binding transcriptional LysR family regulator
MATRPDNLGELRVGDVSTFLTVCRTGSLTGAARELRVTASQVSKAIVRLEAMLRVRLLSRSSRGVALSDAGHRVMPHLAAAVSRLELAARGDVEDSPELTLAAPSSLMGPLLPFIVRARPSLRVCAIELPSPLVRAYAAENFFDACILGTGIDRLPSTWSSVAVGELRQGLLASPVVARRLGRQPVAVEKLKQIPFIGPVYNVGGQFVPVSDDCPLAVSERVSGHKTQTIALALQLAEETEQLVFGPIIAAHAQLVAGTLVEIRVAGWDVREAVNLVSNGDRVLANVRDGVAEGVRRALVELDPG